MRLTSQTKRRLVYGGNAILVVIIMVCLLASLNFLAYRYSYRMDLTQNQLFSVSTQSENIVSGLKSDVVMQAFMPESSNSYEESKNVEFIKDLLDEYSNLSSKVKVVEINPNKEPQLAKDAGIRFLPALSISFNGLNEIIYGSKINEQNITATLVKMSRDKIHTIGFLNGKGGVTLAENLTVLRSALENEGYQTEAFNIASQKDLSIYSAVIVAGPKSVFNESEKFVIDKYIYEGGKVLFALDPMFNTGIEDLIESYGVKVEDDYIIDEKSYMWDLLFRGKFYHWPVIIDFIDSQIVRNFGSVLLPLARSLSLKDGLSEEIVSEELMKTTMHSWAETDTTSGTAEFTEGVDPRGPLTVAISLMGKFSSFYEGKDLSVMTGAEGESIDMETISDTEDIALRGENKEARIVVIGDSDFMTDQHIKKNYNNGDLILNTINWLIEDEDLISIRPKEAEDRRINPMSETIQNLVFWGNLLGMSLIVLIYGLARYLLIKKSRKKIL